MLSDLIQLFLGDVHQIFHYTRYITPKCVTSLWGPSPRHCTRATRLLSKKFGSSDEPLATLCLIRLKFKPQTYRSRDERGTARPTGWSVLSIILYTICTLNLAKIKIVKITKLFSDSNVKVDILGIIYAF